MPEPARPDPGRPGCRARERHPLGEGVRVLLVERGGTCRPHLSGRLDRVEIANPPETRDDLAVYPGAITATFTNQVVNGITYEPIGISTSYSWTNDGNWLGGEQPRLQVLYRVKR